MNIFELPVHPAADIPPMLDDEKLKLLSESIQSDGLQQPIVIAEVDGEWTLIDGRNRRKACQMAGVEPEVRKLNGADPAITIFTSDNRRATTAGQGAAIAVKRAELFQWNNQEHIASASGVSQPSIAKAFTISEYKPQLLDKIINESYPFSKAYKEAQEEKRSLEQGSDGFKWLKKNAPDLAKKVEESADDEEPYLLVDAIAAAEGRIEREQSENKNYVTSVMHGLKSATNGLAAFEKGDALNEALKLTTEHSYCKEEMALYFTDSELYALKNKAAAITAGAKQITSFLKELK